MSNDRLTKRTGSDNLAPFNVEQFQNLGLLISEASRKGDSLADIKEKFYEKLREMGFDEQMVNSFDLAKGDKSEWLIIKNERDESKKVH